MQDSFGLMSAEQARKATKRFDASEEDQLMEIANEIRKAIDKGNSEVIVDSLYSKVEAYLTEELKYKVEYVDTKSSYSRRFDVHISW